MRPVLAIATRNILPNEDDNGDDDNDDGKSDEEAYLNPLPTGLGTHFPKEKKKKKKRKNATKHWRAITADRRGGITLPLSLPQLFHYCVTSLLVVALLYIVVLRPASGAPGAIVSYVYTSSLLVICLALSNM